MMLLRARGTPTAVASSLIIALDLSVSATELDHHRRDQEALL